MLLLCTQNVLAVFEVRDRSVLVSAPKKSRTPLLIHDPAVFEGDEGTSQVSQSCS